uniref:Uncharacterized protein n=7 Tax=Aegilops tauschii subsp. strangulata TaxID=200361 RepID=A0A453BLS9_AEGTS
VPESSPLTGPIEKKTTPSCLPRTTHFPIPSRHRRHPFPRRRAPSPLAPPPASPVPARRGRPPPFQRAAAGFPLPARRRGTAPFQGATAAPWLQSAAVGSPGFHMPPSSPWLHLPPWRPRFHQPSSGVTPDTSTVATRDAPPPKDAVASPRLLPATRPLLPAMRHVWPMFRRRPPGPQRAGRSTPPPEAVHLCHLRPFTTTSPRPRPPR